MPDEPKSKYWVFTVNNYLPANEVVLRGLVGHQHVCYLVFGRELAPTTGTKHLQGYVEFSVAKFRTLAQSILCIGSSYIVPRAAKKAHQAADYCKKEGDFEEFGEISQPQQGKRNDLLAIVEEVKLGATARDVAALYPAAWCRNHRAIDRLISFASIERNWITRVYILWGSTGVGKTRLVMWGSQNDLWKSFDPTGKWFDGYCGQSHVLFDEFNGVGCRIQTMLELLDRYPCTVQVKGGTANWAPQVVWITSNCDPYTWFQDAPPSEETWAAFFRRVTRTFHITGPISWVDGVPGLTISLDEINEQILDQ